MSKRLEDLQKEQYALLEKVNRILYKIEKYELELWELNDKKDQLAFKIDKLKERGK